MLAIDRHRWLRPGRRASLPFLIVLAAVAGTLVGVFIDGQLRPEDQQHDAGAAFDYRDRFTFDSLSSMAATADLVAEGVIVQSRRGDPIELDGATGPVISPLYFTELTIAIDRTYLGASGDTIVVKALTLTTQPDFVTAPTFPFAPDSEFLAPGARSILFLDALDDGSYRLLNRQGAFLMGQDRATALDQDGPSLTGTQSSPDAIRSAVDSASLDASTGRITPAEPAR